MALQESLKTSPAVSAVRVKESGLPVVSSYPQAVGKAIDETGEYCFVLAGASR